MALREALLALALTVPTLLIALAGPAVAEGGGFAWDGPRSLKGEHLAFEVGADTIERVTAGGAPVLASVEMGSAGAAGALEDPEGARWEWEAGDGTWEVAAVDAVTPTLRLDLRQGASLKLTPWADVIPKESAAGPLTLAFGAGVAVLVAEGPGGALVPATRSGSGYQYDGPVRLTVHFLLGESLWTRLAALQVPVVEASFRMGDGSPRLDPASPHEAITRFEAASGERVRFRALVPLKEDGAWHALHLRFAPGFFGPVTSPRQLLVEAGDRIAVQLKAEDLLAGVGGAGPFYNLTATREGGWDLVLIAHGARALDVNVTRDVTPPALVGNVRLENLTHQDLFIYTETHEYALVEVQLQGGGDRSPDRTTVLALRQTFPIQGLRPDTEYRYTVTAEDAAGNEARLAEGTFRTLQAPKLPAPTFTDVYPPKGARLTEAPTQVIVKFESPDSPARLDSVRLFVDKREVDREKFQVLDGQLHYVPPNGFAPGPHSVSVEVWSEAGGKGVVAWSFEVTQGTPAPGLVATAVALLALAGLVRRLR